MHDIGDALVRAGLESVVMDVENITMTYTDSMDLMRELKALGAHNVNKDRHKGLTGKVSFKKMMHYYEKFRETEKLPASFEIIYGHAWKPETPMVSRDDNGVSYVPVSAIKKLASDK
jgi:malonyl-CoA O-methyltransferase